MQKYILVLVLILGHTFGSAQKARDLFFEGLEESKAGNDKKAIVLYTKSIELEPGMAISRYNRAISYYNLKNYNEALDDLDKAITINPKHAKSYLLRAAVNGDLKKYREALIDIDIFLDLAPENGEGEYYKAVVYKDMGNKDSACMLYAQSLGLGYVKAKSKVTECDDDTTVIERLNLSKVAENKSYGFDSKNPVKVGGSPSTQREYLDMLIDAQGKHISYKRSGSCCAYKSTSTAAIFGMAMVDIYSITYRNEKNKEVTENVYISFYDYEEPLILLGFSAAK